MTGTGGQPEEDVAEVDALVEQAMIALGLSQFADTHPYDLPPALRRLVAVGAVLAMDSDLLVLDEPTAGLDAGGKELYQQAIQGEQSRGASLVVATHDIQEAINCGQAMLLARKVIAYGPGRDIITPEALLEAFGIVITLDQQHRGVAVIEREHGHDHEPREE